ncbi:MAG: DUF4956 domain-containing protein [Eubacteriales bacterium]|nr:DUF4956 domain-containing protein [Eubacteriales bacterium]
MHFIETFNHIKAGFDSAQLPGTAVVAVLFMVTCLSLYQFVIYRFVSKRSFYSKQFNVALAVIPYFIATIIMTLQSNIIITLGTIGALAIIRFRTAIKDPMDMVYLLWSVHTGIMCGAGQYEMGVLTSLAVTVLILVLDLLPMKRAPYLLVINARGIAAETQIMAAIKKHARRPRVKSRNLADGDLDMIIELRTGNEAGLQAELAEISAVRRQSLVSHDGESIV